MKQGRENILVNPLARYAFVLQRHHIRGISPKTPEKDECIRFYGVLKRKSTRMIFERHAINRNGFT